MRRSRRVSAPRSVLRRVPRRVTDHPIVCVLIRSNLMRSYPIQSYPILSDPILSDLIRSDPISSDLIRSNPIPSHPSNRNLSQATESGAMCSHKTDVAASPSLSAAVVRSVLCALQQSRAKATDSLFDSVWAVLIAEGINRIPVAVWHAMLPCDAVHYTRSVMTGLTPAPSAGRSVHFKRSVMTLFSCDSACAHSRL